MKSTGPQVNGRSGFMQAVHAGHKSIADLMLLHTPAADVNLANRDGVTPLHLACQVLLACRRPLYTVCMGHGAMACVGSLLCAQTLRVSHNALRAAEWACRSGDAAPGQGCCGQSQEQGWCHPALLGCPWAAPWLHHRSTGEACSGLSLHTCIGLRQPTACILAASPCMHGGTCVMSSLW